MPPRFKGFDGNFGFRPRIPGAFQNAPLLFVVERVLLTEPQTAAACRYDAATAVPCCILAVPAGQFAQFRKLEVTGRMFPRY